MSEQHITEDVALSHGGYSIFNETLVDATYPEVEEAARQGAVVLWPVGVIEQHGPHLPLGVDVYLAYIQMKDVARRLRSQGKKAVIAPPLYWGINEATASFAGSFSIRPSTFKSLIEDTFLSLRKDGFQTVYVISGHGERRHNQVILEGIVDARTSTGIRAFFVLNGAMARRLGLTGSEPYAVVIDRGLSYIVDEAPAAPASGPLDIHAGRDETSLFWYGFPEITRGEMLSSLTPTNYGPEDLAEWRKGWENGRAKTPLGYFGDPASASRELGRKMLEEVAASAAAAISQHMDGCPWIKSS